MPGVGEIVNRESQRLAVSESGDAVSAPSQVSLAQLRQLAIQHQRSGNAEQAIKLYRAILQINPADIGIWSNLGAALRKQKHYQSAVNCYRRALEIKPGDVAALGNLANALKDLHRLDEAIVIHRQVIEQKPTDVQALMNYACALRESGQFAEALEQLDDAQAIEPNNAGVEWERAQNLLYLGRYSEGWKTYEARWRTGELPKPKCDCPQWRGEPITGKTILLLSEQGYGDTILAARYIKLVKEKVGKNGKVILQCKPELHRLFKTIGADQLITPEQSATNIDLYCPLMSLMGCFDTQPDTIPSPAQLHIPLEAKQKFAYLNQQHPGKKKIGIVWSGSVTFKNNDNRSLPLSAFLPLAEIPDVRLYSLQKGPRLSELQENGAEAYIEDIGSRCEDFADTAAAIENLDLIIMTDSSVAHLAASLNKPVINLIQKVPYWLYALDEHTTPWYPSMCIARHDGPDEWIKTVLQKINRSGNDFLENNRFEENRLPAPMCVINLDRRPDRWKQFCTINNHYTHMVRQPAMDAEVIDINALIVEGRVHETSAGSRRSEIACALSHRAVWLKAIATDTLQCVSEDDVILRDDFQQAVLDVIVEAPDDWDFILLGCNTDSIVDVDVFDGLRMQGRFIQFDNQTQRWQVCGNMLAKSAAFMRTKSSVALFKLHHAFGLGSYLISAKGAKKLLDSCFPLQPTSCYVPALGKTLNSVALDVVLNAQYSKINAYCVMPPLALPINNKTQSDIQPRPVNG